MILQTFNAVAASLLYDQTVVTDDLRRLLGGADDSQIHIDRVSTNKRALLRRVKRLHLVSIVPTKPFGHPPSGVLLRLDVAIETLLFGFVRYGELSHTLHDDALFEILEIQSLCMAFALVLGVCTCKSSLLKSLLPLYGESHIAELFEYLCYTRQLRRERDDRFPRFLYQLQQVYTTLNPPEMRRKKEGMQDTRPDAPCLVSSASMSLTPCSST